jgi:regulator of replication initiation timing
LHGKKKLFLVYYDGMADKKVEKVSLFNGGETRIKSNPFDFGAEQRFVDSAFEPTKRRINDYDSSILDKQSYQDLDNDTTKLEYRITETEKQLNELRQKIKGAEKIAKVNEVLDLKIQEKALEKELDELNKTYSQKGIKPKLNKAVKKADDNFVWISKLQQFVSRRILPKISPKFDKISKLSASLDTLESINQNIDELIEMKVPYGENKQNYAKLTAYLSRANKIHSQITKSMGKI